MKKHHVGILTCSLIKYSIVLVQMSVYRLSRTISTHSNDVRAVKITSDGFVITASRDGKACYSSADGTSRALLETCAYLNSLAIDDANKIVYIGSFDSTIVQVNLISDQDSYFLGHTANVSCLDYNSQSKMLASGSWDHSIRVWESSETSLELKGHTQNVWDVKFLDETQLLSASADKTIRLWDLRTNKTAKTFVGHNDVVRALVVLSKNEFVSASNDGTLRIWDIQTGKQSHILRGHTSFVYSLALVNFHYLISSGEDRSVRVWDLSTKKCVQTILLPSISQWCVATNKNGDFVVGSSDNTARVFTTHSERFASAEELHKFEQLVKESAMGEFEIDESELADPSILTKPGSQEGQIVVIRNSTKNVMEAHQFSNGAWSKIGDVVGQNQASGSKKQTFEGKQYDYVFDVDVSDNAPPLKLPYNNSENPYSVAEKFIADNLLPPSYIEQVVQFIIQNSQAKSFDASAPVSAPTPKAQVPPDEIPQILKYNRLLALKTFQPDPLLETLKRIANELEENLIAYNIEPLLHSLPSSASDLLKVALELKEKWRKNIANLLPVYDLLRISLPDAASVPVQVVWMNLLDAIDADLPKHTLLAVRGVANLLSRADFDASSARNKSMIQQAMLMVQNFAFGLQNTSKPLAIALATLALNLAVHNPTGLNFAGFMVSITPRILESGDTEALYRVLLAVGLRSVASPAEALNYKGSWFPTSNTEERTSELLKAVILRIN